MMGSPRGWRWLPRQEYATIPDLLEAKCTELSYSDNETLSKVERKSVRDLVKQEYLAYLFINNRNQKLHSQLEKDVANDYSKGNIEAYLSDIHKALTLMNE
jgi:DNA recombination-dependent growth factor C